MPSSGGAEIQIVDDLIHALNFTVVEDGIYYMAAGPTSNSSSIRWFEFATGKSTEILTIDKQNFIGIAISPDRHSLLYSVVGRAGSNLMLVENVH